MNEWHVNHRFSFPAQKSKEEVDPGNMCLSVISKIIDTIYWALLCAGDHAEYFLQSISFNLDLFRKQAYIVICSQSRFPAPSWYHHTYR